MGCNGSKDGVSISNKEYVMELKEKVRILREEISGVVEERKKEKKTHERDAMFFALKEAEWKEEKRMLREEVKMLRKMGEEREEKLRDMVEEVVEVSKDEKERELIRTSFLVDQMREERSRRDEAVEKWKQLYLAIKVDLDDLIQRTLDDNGDAPIRRGGGGEEGEEEEEEGIRELKMEVKSKEETIKSLTLKLCSMEIEKRKKDRDLDILRQSLRITSSSSSSRKGLQTVAQQTLLPNHVVKLNF